MGLNELIKSNIFLVGLYVGLILLIALILYIVRNLSKNKELTNDIDEELDEIVLDDDKGIISKQNLKDKEPSSVDEMQFNFTERFRGRFEVINKFQQNDTATISKHDQKLGNKDVYEKTGSSLMFRFNPHTEHAVE